MVYLKLNIPMVTLTANMIGRYLLTYNYEGQQKNRIALSLLYCFVAALIELIVVFYRHIQPSPSINPILIH